jgi:uncharacterized protein
MNDRNQILKEFAGRYNFSFLNSFGSKSLEVRDFISGKINIIEKNGSDIDIGVYYKNRYKPSIKEKTKLTLELEEFFNINKVDLIDLSEAKTFLALDIIKGELLYCDDPDTQSEFELYILRKAGDLAFFERERRNMIMGVD